MKKRKLNEGFHTNEEELFLSASILDLRQGRITYVYKQNILDKLKEIFDDLDIKRVEFYWSVRKKKIIKAKTGRPKKIDIR